MKFIALLIATVADADAAAADKIAINLSCAAEKAECAKDLCCGTVTDAEAATLKANDATSAVATFAATVCFTTPTAEQLKTEAKGLAFEVKAKVPAVTGSADSADDKAEVPAVMGTFLCNADAAAGDAASYMTVGAAAIIAAATLLQ